MDNGIGPVVVNGEARDVTTTATHGLDRSWEVLSPEQKKALAIQKRSEADQLDAMLGSEPIVAPPTSDQLTADLASQEQSAKGLAKDPTAANPMEEAAATAAAESDPRTTDEILNGQEAFPRFGEGTIAAKPAVTPRFTSQQFGQAVDATRPTTAVAQRDEVAADEAATRQRLAEQELARREEVQKQVAAMQAKWQADMDKASAEYAKTTSLNARQVTPLLAIAAGLGALGATLGKTRNFAGDAIEKEMDRSLEEKKALMHGGLQKLEALKAGPAQIEKFREAALADILAKQKAELTLMEAASAKMMARFPQSADALRLEMAKAKAGFDKANTEFMGARTKRAFSQEGTDQTVSSAKGGNISRKTESEQKLNLLGESMKAELAAIRKGEPLDSDDLDQVQKDTLAAEAADKTSEAGQISAGGVGLGRRVGAVSKSRYQNLSGAKQKTMNAWDNAIEKYARVLTGAGMPAEEARRMSRQNGPTAGDTPEVIEFKLQRLEREAERMVGLSQNAAATMAGKTERKGGASTSQAGKLTFSDQEKDALKWARDNPGPKADAIKAKIRKDKGIK